MFNPFSSIKGMLIAGAVVAGIGAFYWFADKIGDSRELEVRKQETQRSGEQNDAEVEARIRVRNCHARGPDWLWDTAKGSCEHRPLSKAGEGTGGGQNSPATR